MALTVLVLIQGTLGGLVVWTSKAVLPNTLHVGTGALLIGVSVVLTLTSRRLSWLAERQTVPSEAASVDVLGAERATT
jgi:heme A synthase